MAVLVYDFAEVGKIVDASATQNVHYNVGSEVRTAIEKIGGTMPEDLPKPKKSIQEIEREEFRKISRKKNLQKEQELIRQISVS